MSLNWNTKACNVTDAMYEDGSRLLTDHAADTRQSIIFNMMFVGINNLATRVQCETFYNRYLQYTAAQGYGLKDAYLSYADVVMWKGIATNASSMTDAAFAKKVRETIQRTTWESFSAARTEQGDY